MNNNTIVECIVLDSERILCNGTQFDKNVPPLTSVDLFFWIYFLIYVLLTMGAGLMSGLTLGLLSLDTLSLEVLMKAGVGKEAKYAEKLFPIIKHHHILLVTLLLGNAACVESMPIFLDRISDPVTAIITSVTAVLIFGEIIPQALCKRYGLAIGYYLRPLVYFLMAISIVIAYPISKLLDFIFGHDSSTYYGRSQLKALIDLHGPSRIIVKNDARNTKQVTTSDGDGKRISSFPPDGSDNYIGSSQCIDDEPDGMNQTLTIEEVTIIKGALDLTTKTARDALVPLEEVFMLSDETVLNESMMKIIAQTAHSRIPIYYSNERRLLRGILITKMLIQVDPHQNITVNDIIKDQKGFRPLHYVIETTPLYDLLQLFKTGKTGHMAVVVKEDIQDEELDALDRFYSMNYTKHPGSLVKVYPPVMGIITLEDVLERLIQSDIHDEGDLHRTTMSRRMLNKQKLRRAKSTTNTRSRSASRAMDKSRQHKRDGSARSYVDHTFVSVGSSQNDLNYQSSNIESEHNSLLDSQRLGKKNKYRTFFGI